MQKAFFFFVEESKDFATIMISTIDSLLTAKKDIRLTLHRHHMHLQLVKNTQSVSVSGILDFADNITLSNKAMSGWIEGMPLGKSNPPAPQPEQMRDSYLQKHHREVNSSTGVQSAMPKSSIEIDNPNIHNLVEKLLKKRSDTSSISDQKENGDAQDEDYLNSGFFEEQENKRARKFNITFDVDSDED